MNDVDLERKTLTVNKKLTEQADNVPYQLLPLKTFASSRTIALSAETVFLLKYLKDEIFAQSTAFVFEYEDNQLSSSIIGKYFNS